MSSVSKGMTQARREKLEKIQQREQLKSLLVSKFKSKYQGQHNPRAPSVATTVINAEVNKFVENEKLNEENLKRLDDRIREAGATKPKPGRPEQQGSGIPDDAISVRSIASSKMSGVSKMSKRSQL